MAMSKPVVHLNQHEQAKLDAIRTNLPYFANNFLKIADAAGQIVPLKFNDAQMYLHNEVEKMKRETGMVRLIILKGRKMGISTYVGARYFQQTNFNKGRNAFVMAHDGETSKSLFNLVHNYYANLPAALRSQTKASNAKELIFEGNYSRYGVGTAGNDQVGRGTTPQLLHGSEVGFWKRGENLAAGIIQAVADVAGTEVILESTANGMDAFFYKNAMAAMQGHGNYRMVFLPWFWHIENRAEPEDDFKRTDAEQKLVELYGLDDRQLQFRRNKIALFGDREWKFKQEYPSNAIEAFQTSGNPLIPIEAVMAARKLKLPDDPGMRPILGVDKGRSGVAADRTVLALRRGRKFKVKIYRDGMNEPQLANIIAKLLQEIPHLVVNIDVGDGTGAYDLLCEWGWSAQVNAVYFGAAASDPKVFANKRVEMYCDLRDAIIAGASIPDDDEVHADLTATPDYKHTSNNRMILVSKEKIKEDFQLSPDIADAMALTYAYPVTLPPAAVPASLKPTGDAATERKTPLSSLQR